MKTLKDYITESISSKKAVKEAEPIKPQQVELNFDGLDDGDKIKKDIIAASTENGIAYEDNDKKLSLTINANDVEKYEEIVNILTDFCKKIRKSSKRTNDELYAQKTKSFEKKVNKIKEILDNTEDIQDDQSNNDDEE